jgi:hypothetical protein
MSMASGVVATTAAHNATKAKRGEFATGYSQLAGTGRYCTYFYRRLLQQNVFVR